MLEVRERSISHAYDEIVKVAFDIYRGLLDHSTSTITRLLTTTQLPPTARPRSSLDRMEFFFKLHRLATSRSSLTNPSLDNLIHYASSDLTTKLSSSLHWLPLTQESDMLPRSSPPVYCRLPIAQPLLATVAFPPSERVIHCDSTLLFGLRSRGFERTRPESVGSDLTWKPYAAQLIQSRVEFQGFQACQIDFRSG